MKRSRSTGMSRSVSRSRPSRFPEPMNIAAPPPRALVRRRGQMRARLGGAPWPARVAATQPTALALAGPNGPPRARSSRWPPRHCGRSDRLERAA